MVVTSAMWLNMFTFTDGIYTTIIPGILLTGIQINNKNNFIGFGLYAQIYEEHDNGMGSRSIGAIDLCVTGNTKVGQYLFILGTRRRINWHLWTKLPITTEVVDRVHVLNYHIKSEVGLTYRWWDGPEIFSHYELDQPLEEYGSDYDTNDDDEDT